MSARLVALAMVSVLPLSTCATPATTKNVEEQPTATRANEMDQRPDRLEEGMMKPSSHFINGTRILAVVIENFNRDEVEGSPWKPSLLEAGYRDEDIADGSDIAATTFCYGHNPCVIPIWGTGHCEMHSTLSAPPYPR